MSSDVSYIIYYIFMNVVWTLMAAFMCYVNIILVPSWNVNKILSTSSINLVNIHLFMCWREITWGKHGLGGWYFSQLDLVVDRNFRVSKFLWTSDWIWFFSESLTKMLVGGDCSHLFFQSHLLPVLVCSAVCRGTAVMLHNTHGNCHILLFYSLNKPCTQALLHFHGSTFILCYCNKNGEQSSSFHLSVKKQTATYSINILLSRGLLSLTYFLNK